MTSFNLTVTGTSYTLKTDGSVATAAGAFGTWTTDGKKTNQIVIKKADSTTIPVDVKWTFNAKNQLCLAQGAAQVFNFTNGAVHPRLSLDSGNKLHVVASPANSLFEFPLVCGFALSNDTNADLKITIGTETSTIVGKPNSNKAYFGYTFRDTDAPIPGSSLAFTGAWTRDDTKPSKILLIFSFKVDADVFKLAMPASATVSQQNQLLITGMKNGQGWGVEIQGALELRKDNKDFSLVFTLSHQHTATGIQDTTIEVKAVFAPDDSSSLKGYLDLYIGQQKTTDSKRVTVKGEGHVSLGDTSLDITFAYTSTQTGGQPAVVGLAASATFAWKDGKLAMTFMKDGTGTTVMLASEFTLNDNLRVQAYLNVTKAPGQQAGVYGALGLSW
ncbi:MAG TPA: hypothetical protein VII56_04735 [Rhizomicrobium sp.]